MSNKPVVNPYGAIREVEYVSPEKTGEGAAVVIRLNENRAPTHESRQTLSDLVFREFKAKGVIPKKAYLEDATRGDIELIMEFGKGAGLQEIQEAVAVINGRAIAAADNRSATRNPRTTGKG